MTTLSHRGFLVTVLAAMNLLDLATTRYVLALGGQEANPVMAPIIHHPYLPMLVKLAGCGLVAWTVYRCPPRSPLVNRALLTVTSAYTLVVAWNLVNIGVAT